MSAEILREAAALMRERASWHPTVALAVADLLDRLADEDAEFYNLDHPALVLARAYLGRADA